MKNILRLVNHTNDLNDAVTHFLERVAHSEIDDAFSLILTIALSFFQDLSLSPKGLK